MTIAPATRTRALQAWRELRAGGPDDVTLRVFATPVLLREDVLDALREEPELADDPLTAPLSELLAAIAAQVDAEPWRYPVGPGPIESLWRAVDEGRRSVEQATAACAAMPITESLRPAYVERLLSRLAFVAFEDSGDRWREARVNGRLVLAAADASERRDEPAFVRARLTGLLRWAHGLLLVVPDRRLLDEADAAGRRILALARSPEDERETRFLLAALWGDPYSYGRTSLSWQKDDEAWTNRGHTELSVRDGRPAADWAMPPAEEALRTALSHWSEARRLAPDDQAVLAGFAETAVWLSTRLHTEPDEDARAAVAHALELHDGRTESEPMRQRLVMLGRMLGLEVDDAIPSSLLAPSDDLVRQHGADAPEVVLRTLMATRDRDPIGALALLDRHRELLLEPNQLRDSDFTLLVHETVILLNRAIGHPAATEEPSTEGSFEDHVRSILEQVGDSDAEPTRLAVVVLRLAARASRFDAEAQGLALLGHVGATATLFARHFDWLIRALEAVLLTGEAVNEYNAGDRTTALRLYVRSLDKWSSQGRSGPVRDLLGRLADIADAADETTAIELAGALVPLAPALIGSVGDEVDAPVQRVWRSMLGSLLEAGTLNSEILWALFQFGKGLRSAMTLARHSPVRVRSDPTIAGLLATLEEHRAAHGSDVPAPLATRVAFEERWRQLQVQNLAPPDLLDLAQMRRALDERTVVVTTYSTVDRNEHGRVIAFVVWAEDQVLCATETMPLSGDDVPFVPYRLFEVLKERRAEGRDHLCVIGHAGSQTLPWHLLQDDDSVLADQWTVTSLPHPHLLWRSRGSRSVIPSSLFPVVCFARGFDGGIGDLAPITEAVDEARQIAERLGGTSLVDAAATEAELRRLAPLARYVHVATHGVFQPDTPCFHHLVLNPTEESDGVLNAWEIGELDLTAVRTVTLSACETAMLAVDRSDNVAGLPMAFLAAGAQSVIGTLWKIRSDVSQHFFATLYEQLAVADVDLRDAFAAAQRDTRATYPESEDWGAFYFLGDWR